MKQVTPIHLIRSFESAARHCSFTQAAEELHITQAAISKQIKTLEKELNTLLFNRNAHGVSLTQAGERYWQDTRGLINKLDNITTQLFTERKADTITIRANISYGVDVLSQKIKWLQSNYPDMVIELTHSVWSKSNQLSNADIEIDYRNIDPKKKAYKLLQRDNIFPVVANTVNQNELMDLPTIHILGYYNEWTRWLKQALDNLEKTSPGKHREWISTKLEDINHNKNILRVDNSLSAYKLAIENTGIALGRSSLVTPYIENKLLKPINNKVDINALEGFHIHLTESGRAKKACVDFLDYLLDSVNI